MRDSGIGPGDRPEHLAVPGTRAVEAGVRKRRVDLSYGQYLHLDELLGAQHRVSDPPHHDELLVIIQHQTSELWLKLVLHELRHVRDCLATDDLRRALKSVARVKHVLRQLTGQWAVLATLTPSEYRESPGRGSSSLRWRR